MAYKKEQPDKSGDKVTEPLVLVAKAPNDVVANMWADILLQEGIKVLIKQGPVSSYATAFGESVEIYALASKSVEAKEILRSFIEPA